MNEGVDFGNGFSPKDVACAGERCCSMSVEDTIKCWGDNGVGQLGYGDTNNRGDEAGEMGPDLPLVELPSDFVPSEMTMTQRATCILSTVGDVLCFGRNHVGQLGIGHKNSVGDNFGEMGDNLDRVDFGSAFGTVKQIGSGDSSFCAVSEAGKVTCWGRNKFGQLGLGHTADRGDSSGEMGDNLEYTDLGTGFVAQKVSCSENSCCASSTDGAMKCWGEGKYGMLGYGDDTSTRGDKSGEMGDNLETVPLGSDFLVRDFEAGWRSVCAVSTAGAVKCWGSSGDCQLGLGGGGTRGDDDNEMGDFLPSVDVGPGFRPSALQIAPGRGRSFNCVFEETSKDLLVKCFGITSKGQLGYGDNNRRGCSAAEMGANLAFLSFGEWPPAECGCDEFNSLKDDLNSLRLHVAEHDAILNDISAKAQGDQPNVVIAETSESKEFVDDFTPILLGAAVGVAVVVVVVSIAVLRRRRKGMQKEEEMANSEVVAAPKVEPATSMDEIDTI